jgi:hypothetical protein
MAGFIGDSLFAPKQPKQYAIFNDLFPVYLLTSYRWTPFQQHSSPLEQPQLGSFPVSQPAITAAAHPTPASTVMTFTGQFFAQAPHSIQLSLSATRALFSLILKTL